MHQSTFLTRSNAIRLGGLLLGGYISLLIGLVYLGQIHLRQSLFEQAKLTIEKQASAVNYFLSEQQDEIKEFTKNPALNNFFANRAMGMSMKYGLRASLLTVQNELKRLLNRKKLLGQPVYTAISFVDRDGSILVSTKETEKQKVRSFHLDGDSAPGVSLRIFDNKKLGYDAYYVATIDYHNQVTGLIIAEVNLAKVVLPLLQHSENNRVDNTLMLIAPHDKILVSTAPVSDPNSFSTRQQTTLSVPLDDSGYILKGIIRNNQQMLLTSPWFLAAIALLSLPVVGGLFLLLRLNNNHLLLQAKYLASQQQEQELRYFRRLLDLSTDLIAVIDPSTSRYLDVNQTMCTFFSLDREQLLKKKFIDHSDTYRTIEQWRLFLKQIRKNERITDEYNGQHPDGSPFFIEINAHYAQLDDREAIVAIFRDISERKRSEQVIQQANQRVNAVLAGIDAIVYVMDMETHTILYANTAATTLYGDLVGKTCWQHLHSGQTGPCSFCPNDKLLGDDGKPAETYIWEFQHGENNLWFHSADCAIPWDDGRYVHLQVATDITARIQNEQALQDAHSQLEALAYYDPLTRLANRRLFIDRLQHALHKADRINSGLAICYLDLDEFKQINDTYGHEAGDDLLVQVGERLLNNLRGEDTVARWGGDEFALLITNQKDEEQCVETLSRLLDCLTTPYEIRSTLFQVTTSVGVTLYPKDNGDPETLLRHADQAMYLAKQKGRNCYHFFDPEQDRRINMRLEQINCIGKAIKQDELRLFYQPKIDMARGRVMGAEALVRWQHPEEGLLPPVRFLPLIEGHRLQLSLDWWVLDKAMQQASFWQTNGEELSISVNIAAQTIQQPGFADRLIELLADYGIDGGLIELEILESGIIDELDTISSVIRQCVETGISFALDDYGTGFSSLTHIRRLPVQTLKIDQSFVREMLDNRDDFHIVEGVIGLARAFELEVIAEGVETTKLGTQLLKLGCNYAQGYCIAKPMPSSEITDWRKQYKVPEEWLKAAAEKTV